MRLHSKRFTSLLLTITFATITVSGGVLYIAPRCRVAEQIGWTVMGLGKDQWESLHINGALLFVLAGLLHVVLNWTIFWSYIKKRGSLGPSMTWELFFAMVLGGVVVAGSLFGFALARRPKPRGRAKLGRIRFSWWRTAVAMCTTSLSIIVRPPGRSTSVSR